jgi:hypothetical protein
MPPLLKTVTDYQQAAFFCGMDPNSNSWAAVVQGQAAAGTPDAHLFLRSWRLGEKKNDCLVRTTRAQAEELTGEGFPQGIHPALGLGMSLFLCRPRVSWDVL